MRMKTTYSEKETVTVVGKDGKETRNIVEKTRTYNRVCEPDYIKLYVKPWTSMGHDGSPGIPMAYRDLFLQLAMRMSYCNSDDPKSAQVVNTGAPYSKDIMRALNWSSPSMYARGLKALVDCKAIRRIGRGVYQVNPAFASRGEWTYNSKLHRGGVKEVIDLFRLEAGREPDGEREADGNPADVFGGDPGSVTHKRIWADDGGDTPGNREWREGLGIDWRFNGGSLETVTREPGRDEGGPE